MDELNQKHEQNQQGVQSMLLLDSDQFTLMTIACIAVAFIEVILCSLIFWNMGLIELGRSATVDSSAGTFELTASLSIPCLFTSLGGVFLAVFMCLRVKKQEDRRVLFKYVRLVAIVLALLIVFFVPMGTIHTEGGAINLVADESASLFSLLRFALAA